jgi:hypothetical protein
MTPIKAKKGGRKLSKVVQIAFDDEKAYFFSYFSIFGQKNLGLDMAPRS